MDIQNVREHLLCYDWDAGDRPTIESREIEINTSWEIETEMNKLLFLMSGDVSVEVGDFKRKEVNKGYFWFVSAGQSLKVSALDCDALLLILRFSSHMNLCDCYMMEQLYNEFRNQRAAEEVDVKQLYPCYIRPMLWECLNNLFITTIDGLCCRSFFQVKVKEVFFLLRAYIPKRELYGVFHPILTADITFSDRVKSSWAKYPTVDALARSMNLTPSTFYRRFVAVFAKTPLDWYTEQKKMNIYKDIVSTELSLREVATKWYFSSPSSLTHWCEKHFGQSPSTMRKQPPK
jgi:AraC-like DNA-binding protein